MSKIQALIACIVLLSTWAHAQTFNVKGIVKSPDGSALPGAYVHIHELEFNTVSDEYGKFEFKNIESGFYHLHVKFIGYQEKSVKFEINGQDIDLIIQLEEAYKELDEIIVESSFSNDELRESSLSIEAVNADKIMNSGAGSFANALEELPGISSINTGVGISKPVIRGMSFNRVMVNDNGIKQEGQQWGSDHGLEIDQFAAKRVEIVKGPNTLIYGSDALGGAINILPEIIPLNGSVNGEIRSTYRSNNQTVGNSVMLEGSRQDIYARARLSILDFSDYRVPADNFIYNNYELNLLNERLKNTAGKERNASVTLGLRKRWGNANINASRFDQASGLFPGALGIPRAYDLGDDGDLRNIDLPKQRTTHDKVIINSNWRIRKNWMELKLGFQNNQRREFTLPHAHGIGPVPEGSEALNLKLHTLTYSLRYNRRINEKSKDIIGLNGQFQENKESGYEHLLSPYRSSQTGLYYVFQYKLRDNLNFSAGGRVDYGKIEIHEFNAPVWQNADTILYYSLRNENIQREFLNYSASFGLSWFLNPNTNLKFNVGRSFRIPTAAELSINGVHHGTFRHELGNKDLNSEKGLQVDVSGHYNYKSLSISLSPYFNYFEDYIYLSPTSNFGYLDQTGNIVLLPEAGQAFQYRQNDALIYGLEFSSDYHVIRNLHWEFAAEYVYKQNLNSGLSLPFTPPASIQNTLEYNWDLSKLDWSIGAQWKKYFDQNNVDRNERTTPGYDLYSVNLGVDFNAGKKKFAVYLKARNLLNTKYFNHLSRYRLLNLPEQGRDIIVNASITF